MLHLDSVTVRYPSSDAPAVQDLTIEVGPGETVALIGPSGAGKSTVLALSAGLTLPSSGSVRTFGIDSTELASRSHRPTRRRIGIVSQDFSLVGKLQVARNVAAGRLGQWSWFRALRSLVRPAPLDEIAVALDRVGIAEKIWDRTDQLSGGQQQRTAIARVLFQGPDLLLADEPVSALDPARSDAVMTELVGSVDGSQALVASMHDAPLALRHCGRIIGLREGRVFFDLRSEDVTDALLSELYVLNDAP